MVKRKRLLMGGFVLAALAAVGLGGFLGGFVMVEKKLPGYQALREQLKAVRTYVAGQAEESRYSLGRVTPENQIQSTVLNLALERIPVPGLRKNSGGGGFTSFGEDLVLVAYDGRIFRVEDGQAVAASIAVPDNGFAAYQAYAAAADDGLYHYPNTLRYNDILAYSDGDRSYLVLSYTEWRDAERCYDNVLARLPLQEGATSLEGIQAQAEDWEIVYRSVPCLPLTTTGDAVAEGALDGKGAAGRLVHAEGHRVLLVNGAFSWDGVVRDEALPQKDGNDYGKVVQVDLESGATEIVAKGLRNAQGIAVDASGSVWAVDQGPQGGDELNRIAAGGDYGWPQTSLGTLYSREPWPMEPQVGRHRNGTAPTFAWMPSIAPSSLTVIDGFHPFWDGDLLVGSLVGARVDRIRIRDGRVLFSEPISIGERVRDVHQHSDGRLALWTDNEAIVMLSPAPPSVYDNVVEDTIRQLREEEAGRAQLRAALESCRRCHLFKRFGSPDRLALGGVYEDGIGATEFSGYSEAIRARTGLWNDETLKAFLLDPQRTLPGTNMPDPELRDEALAEDIVKVLRRIALVID